MEMIKQRKNTVLFICFIVLAGICYLLSKTGNTLYDTFFNSMNCVIYIGLVLFWLQSVRERLLTDRPRLCIIAIACLMLLYLIIRIYVYNYAQNITMIRYCRYAYWIPNLLIPALFLITCIMIRRGNQEKTGWNEKLVLIPACVLSFLVLSNDLHRFVYIPSGDISLFTVDTGTYSYGAGFILLYIWMILATVTGLVLLFRETGSARFRIVRSLIIVITIWTVSVVLNLIFHYYPEYKMFNIPESNIFGMMGVIEICIRYRLIPYNENYAGFFSKLQIPVLITDTRLHPVYRTKAQIPAGAEKLKEALSQPVLIKPDTRLYSREIQAGYAFWTVDERAVHRAQEQLVNANEIIEGENNLIQAETQQREKDAYLRSKHHIYHEIDRQMYPYQKKIAGFLDETVPGREDFRERIAFVSVLNAYVKRKTNLLLLAAEKDSLNISELFLALKESAMYLTLAGLQTTVMEMQEKQYPADTITALYDAFEIIAEQLTGKASFMMISWNGNCMRIAAQTAQTVAEEGINLPVKMFFSEDTFYADVFA